MKIEIIIPEESIKEEVLKQLVEINKGNIRAAVKKQIATKITEQVDKQLNSLETLELVRQGLAKRIQVSVDDYDQKKIDGWIKNKIKELLKIAKLSSLLE